MPLQSLALMNSDFVRARAKAFASRLEREEPDQAKRIPLAFLTAWSREPSLEERQAATGFLDEQSRLYGLGAEGRNKAWVDFCQSMLMSNEFLYLD